MRRGKGRRAFNLRVFLYTYIYDAHIPPRVRRDSERDPSAREMLKSRGRAQERAVLATHMHLHAGISSGRCVVPIYAARI